MVLQLEKKELFRFSVHLPHRPANLLISFFTLILNCFHIMCNVDKLGKERILMHKLHFKVQMLPLCLCDVFSVHPPLSVLFYAWL